MSDWREARRAHLEELFHISPSAMSMAQQKAIVHAADAYALALALSAVDYDPERHEIEHNGSVLWCCSYHWLAAQVEAERGR